MAIGRVSALVCALFLSHATAFDHNWGTVQDMMWGWAAQGELTDDELRWFATNYKVIVIGGAAPPFNVTDPGQFQLARQLRSINPSVKLLLYEATQFGALGFGGEEIAQHPEWCLTDDEGNMVMRWINGQPHGCECIDWRKQEVRDWWVYTVNQSDSGSGPLFNGLLVDSAGPNAHLNMTYKFSDASVRTISQAKMDMLGMATKFFKDLNDGFVIGNPTLDWGVIGNPSAEAKNFFPVEYHWSYIRGSLDEMFGAFSTQDVSGAWNVTKMSITFDAIRNQSMANQTVMVRGYPGPLGVPFMQVNTSVPGVRPGTYKQITVPTWPAEWHQKQPDTVEGLQKVAVDLLPQALAPYLIVAETNVWFSYAYFYSALSGWMPCTANPGSCLAPPEWYADLKRPIGRPLGPASHVGTVWTRKFEHVTASIDLSDRTKSKLQWQ